MAAYASWAKTADPTARTSAARQASFDRFERQADPDPVLEPVALPVPDEAEDPEALAKVGSSVVPAD